MGWGTYGSRTTAVGGAALAIATRKVKEKAKVIAAHLLEAAVEDMDYADGKFFVKGSPEKAKTIQDVALMAQRRVEHARRRRSRAGSLEPFYDPPNFTYPFGAHMAVVEVDAGNRTRRVQALRRRRRLRPADQPDDRRRTGSRRRRSGHRSGAAGSRPSTTTTASC